MQTIYRSYFHGKRFKEIFIFSIVITSLFLILYATFYPGKEALLNYSNLVRESSVNFLFGEFDVSQPGWTFWLSILVTLLSYPIAILAILLGSKIIPTKDSHSVELFMSNNAISHRRFYLENLSTTVVILLISVSTYSLILITFSVLQSSSDVLDRLLIAGLFLFLSGLFYLALSSVITIASFSSTTGKVAGFGYLIFTLLLDSVVSNNQENLEIIGNLSLNFTLKISSSILSKEYQWTSFTITLIIIILFIIASTLLVTRPNYIEHSTTWFPKFITQKLPSLNPSNLLNPESHIGRKFPIFTEQLRKDFTPLMVVLLLLSLFHLSIYFTVPVDNESLIMVLVASDSPLLRAFIQNNEIQPSFLGYLAVKFYGYAWLYFGIFAAILASSIATREVKNKTQDILWSTSISHTRVIRSRLLAILLEISIVIWYIFLLSTAFSSALNVSISHTTEFQVFLLIWIQYMALTIFLAGVTMTTSVSKGRTVGIFTFIFMVTINVLAFFNPTLEFIKYSSILGYFNPIALLYGNANFLLSALIGIAVLIFSSIFTTILLLYRYRFNDLN